MSAIINNYKNIIKLLNIIKNIFIIINYYKIIKNVILVARILSMGRLTVLIQWGFLIKNDQHNIKKIDFKS